MTRKPILDSCHKFVKNIHACLGMHLADFLPSICSACKQGCLSNMEFLCSQRKKFRGFTTEGVFTDKEPQDMTFYLVQPKIEIKKIIIWWQSAMTAFFFVPHDRERSRMSGPISSSFTISISASAFLSTWSRLISHCDPFIVLSIGLCF